MARFQASDFAELCDGVRSIGEGRYAARCPAHDDSSPSLSIKDGDTALLIHCYAGCEVADICAAVGIKIQELFDDNDFQPSRYPPKDKQLDEMVVWIFEQHRSQGTTLSEKDETTYVDSKLRLARHEGKN